MQLYESSYRNRLLVMITRTLMDPFVALADFKVFLEKTRKRTVHELLRKTPNNLGAKLLTASTAF